MEANPKYGSTYQAIRKQWAAIVELGEARCSEPICLMPSRAIPPRSRWHLSHDPTGTKILGPSHARCNIVESNERRLASPAERPRFLQL